MSQMSKISDVYVPLFESVQRTLNQEDVMNHLFKLTNKSYDNAIANVEQKIKEQNEADTGKNKQGSGVGVISERKKAMQDKLKAAIGNSRL